MERLLNVLEERKNELLREKYENKIRLKEHKVITKRLLKAMSKNDKLKELDGYNEMYAIISLADIELYNELIEGDKRKDIIRETLKQLNDRKEISNTELNIALDILKDFKTF